MMYHYCRTNSSISISLFIFLLLIMSSVPLAAAQNYSDTELLVKYKSIQPGTGLISTARAISNKGLSIARSVGGTKVGKFFRGKRSEQSPQLAGWRKVTFPAGTNILTAQKILQKNPNVEAVSLNYFIQQAAVPNDPRYVEQWALQNAGVTGEVGAQAAWDTRNSTRWAHDDIVVAVIDTGGDYTHEDLQGNLWVNTAEIANDGIDNDNNGCIDDVYGCGFLGGPFVSGESIPFGFGGKWISERTDPSVYYDDQGHGTHVSGIIGATGNNNTGITGIAWNTKIMLVKTLKRFCFSCTIDVAVKGIEYAVDNGANIINASWGMRKADLDADPDLTLLRDAFTYAQNNNVLVVTVPHNDAMDIDDPLSTQARSYPALFTNENMIVVANTDQNDQLNASSSFGATSVDMSAPGTDILSLVPAREPLASADDANLTGYASFSGTSMAAPMVAGAAALVWAHRPHLRATEVKNVLMKTVTPAAALSGITVSSGRLNLAAAMEEIGPAEMVSPVPGSTLTSSNVTFRWSGDLYDETLIRVGTTGPGSFDILKADDRDRRRGDTQQAFKGIPLTGITIYVRLYSFIGGAWEFKDYTYQTGTTTTTPILLLSEITSPTPGSSISTSSATFQWVSGAAITHNYIWAGTSGTGSRNLYNNWVGLNSSVTINNIPQGNGTLFVRLWSYDNGWFFKDYTYQIN